MNWYGIPDVEFIWHGICKDPEIEYQGKRVNAPVIENAMWERYTHDDDGNYISVNASDKEGFSHYMRHNKDEVYELIELAMEGCD